MSPRRLCLITGASAGLGAAFARLYASQGHDLVLTARREDRLQVLAEELVQRCGIEVLVLPADLADPAAVPALLRQIAATGRTVDVLINNAGYGLPGLYSRTRWQPQQDVLQVMLLSVCTLTHALLPGMIARRYGRIINVASLAGLVPGMPSHTLYGPIKSFLVKFSQGLNSETQGTGVHVSALCPGMTWTEFHDANGTRSQTDRLPRWMWQTAEAVVSEGFAAVEGNQALCVTGRANRVIALLARLLPDDLIMWLTVTQARRWREV